MMNAKEKARYLFAMFAANTVHIDETKRCALICVDEMIDEVPYGSDRIDYLNDVKSEIEKL